MLTITAVAPIIATAATFSAIFVLFRRSMYVVLTTVIACALPFFGAFVGLVGALTFWPTAIYYPIAMYKKVYSPKGVKLWGMNAVNIVMGIVAVLATIGSVETIAMSARQFVPFHAAGAGNHGH